MNYKAFYIILFCVITGCFSSSEKKAIKAFSEGNFPKADKLLSEERLQIPAGRYALDKAYILRASEQLELSTAQLKQAYELALKGQSNDLLKKEILLNIALNSYLANDTAAFSESLNKLKKFLPATDPWLRFYEGLSAYISSEYAKASSLWKELRLKYLSPWMEASFKQTFPPDWLEILNMRALILSGEYLTVRKQLEENPLENEDQLNFLLALTYIQEAREKGVEGSTVLFNSAFNHLDKIKDVQKKFPHDITFINQVFLNNINSILSTGHFQDLPYFVDAMQKWSSQEQLDALAKNVTGQVNKLISKEEWQKLDEISPALNDLITDPKIRVQLSKQFESLVKETLSKGNIGSAEKLNVLARLFNPNPKIVDDRISVAVIGDIFDLIKQPQFSEEKAQQLLNFWLSIETNPSQRFVLAQKLVNATKPLWAQRNGGTDALTVMRLANSITPSNRQNELKNYMEKQIVTAYSIAIAHNEFDKLNGILEAQKSFGLNASILKDPKEIANLEADAELLYKQENYKKAFQVADWIAAVDPNSIKAVRIAGMSAYQMGDYTLSLKFLRKLPLTSEYIVARAAAEFAAGDSKMGRKLLSQADNAPGLALEVYERLAIFEIQQGKGKDALGWLSESPQMNDEMKVIKLLALYSLHRYEEALQQYSLLPPALSHIEGLLGTAALAAMYLKDYDEAEGYVKELYENGNAKLTKLSAPFKELLRNRNIVPSKNFVAAMYYKYISQNDEKALQQLKQISENEPLAALEQADILIDLGRFVEAQSVLDKIKPIFTNSKKEMPFQERFWFVYAHLQQARGAYLEAKDGWQYYFSLIPESLVQDKSLRYYSQVLFALRQYGKADELLGKIPLSSLSLDDLLLKMEIQFHQNQVPELASAAKALLKKYPDDIYLRLRIAKLLFLTQNSVLYRRALQDMPKQENLDNKSAEVLLQLKRLVGEYESALTLFQSRRDLWQDNPEVLETIYAILEGQSDYEAAKQVARRVSTVMPMNEAYRIFRIQFGDDDIYNENIVQHYAQLYVKKTLSATLQLAYALALQEEALENYFSKDKNTTKFKTHLDNSVDVLQNLIKFYKDVPELYFYLGQAYYLVGNKESAFTNLQEAISLDPSYTEAYLHLGQLYTEKGDWLEAGDALEKAVQYAPSNGVAWRKLGEVQEQQGNYWDAINSYTRAMQYKPNEVDNFITMGKLNITLNNPEQSITFFDKALSLQPNNVEALTELLKALYDPNLRTNEDKLNDIIQRQQIVYEKLYKIDPKGAVPLRKKLMEDWNK